VAQIVEEEAKAEGKSVEVDLGEGKKEVFKTSAGADGEAALEKDISEFLAHHGVTEAEKQEAISNQIKEGFAKQS